MRFTEIVNEIKTISPIRVIADVSKDEISKIKLWENHTEAEMDAILYFGYGRQPENYPVHCILSFDETDSEPKGIFGDLAVIPSNRFAEVFNHIQDILAERNKNDYQRYLMESADKLKSVDALIDMASQTFNASLILIDRDFRILSYSNKIPVTDALWLDNIKKGYCDYDFITAVKNLKSVQMADSGMTPFEVTCSSSPFRKYACRVYCKDSWIGSLLLIEGDQTFRPEHIEMLRMLSSVIGYSLLAHSPELLHRTSDYQRFLYNLLIGTPIENLPEAYRDVEFQNEMKLLYFRSESEKTPSVKNMNLTDTFSRELPSGHVITYRKATVVICPADDAHNIEGLLALFPPENETDVGISRSFRSVELLRMALDEAHDALTVGKDLMPDRKVFSFEEISVSVMLKHFSASEDITRYLHPSFLILKQYDEECGAKLLLTVQEFLKNSCSIKETSEALYLHRNSVIYRIHKAEEIGGFDLSDPDIRFALRMSFHISQIVETFPQ